MIQQILALLFIFPLALPAQNAPVAGPSAVAVEDEPHHHLVLQNNFVRVFQVELAPGDGFGMHRHTSDAVFIVINDATTVSTTPGKADVLRMSKNGQVLFERGGWSHSVRNIGQTAYRAIAIDLVEIQTGARNLCGKQIPGMKPDCSAADDANSARAGSPQFETDQTRVTLTSIRAHQQASFGEANRGELIVAIDGATIAAAGKKEQPLAAGEVLWLGRENSGLTLKNDTGADVRGVVISFKP